MHELFKNPAVCPGEKLPSSILAGVGTLCWSYAEFPISAQTLRYLAAFISRGQKVPQITLPPVTCKLTLNTPSHFSLRSLCNSLCILVQSVPLSPQPFLVLLAPKKRLNKITLKPLAFSELLQKAWGPKEIKIRGNYTHRPSKPVRRDHNRSFSALSVSLLPTTPTGGLALSHSSTQCSRKCHLIQWEKDIGYTWMKKKKKKKEQLLLCWVQCLKVFTASRVLGTAPQPERCIEATLESAETPLLRGAHQYYLCRKSSGDGFREENS